MADVPNRANDPRRKFVVKKVTNPNHHAFGGYHVEDVNNANDIHGAYHMTDSEEKALKNHYDVTVGKGMAFAAYDKKKRKRK